MTPPAPPDRAETAPGVAPEIAALGPRFFALVYAPTSGLGCWRYLSSGKHGPAGAPAWPRFRVRASTVTAARVAYELTGHGSTAGLMLSNACGNPACIRPSHHTVRAYAPGAKIGRGLADYVARGRAPAPHWAQWARHTDGLIAEHEAELPATPARRRAA